MTRNWRYVYKLGYSKEIIKYTIDGNIEFLHSLQLYSYFTNVNSLVSDKIINTSDDTVLILQWNKWICVFLNFGFSQFDSLYTVVLRMFSFLSPRRFVFQDQTNSIVEIDHLQFFNSIRYTVQQKKTKKTYSEIPRTKILNNCGIPPMKKGGKITVLKDNFYMIIPYPLSQNIINFLNYQVYLLLK